jgi:hypothetical protein
MEFGALFQKVQGLPATKTLIVAVRRKRHFLQNKNEAKVTSLLFQKASRNLV